MSFPLTMATGLSGFILNNPEFAYNLGTKAYNLYNEYMTKPKVEDKEEQKKEIPISATAMLPIVASNKNVPITVSPQQFSFINSTFEPGSESKEPKINVGVSMRKDAGRYFESEPNINPNAAFGTNGFTQTRQKRYTDKIYKVVI